MDAELRGHGRRDLARLELAGRLLELLHEATLLGHAETAAIGRRDRVGGEFACGVLELALARHDVRAQLGRARPNGGAVGRAHGARHAHHRHDGAPRTVEALAVGLVVRVDLRIRDGDGLVGNRRRLPAGPGDHGRVVRVLVGRPEVSVRDPDVAGDLQHQLLLGDFVAVVVLEVDQQPLQLGRRGVEQAAVFLDVKAAVRLQLRRAQQGGGGSVSRGLQDLVIRDADATLLVFLLQEQVSDQLFEGLVVHLGALVERQSAVQLLFLLLRETLAGRQVLLVADSRIAEVGARQAIDGGDFGRGRDRPLTHQSRGLIEHEAADERRGDQDPDVLRGAPHGLQHGANFLTWRGNDLPLE